VGRFIGSLINAKIVVVRPLRKRRGESDGMGTAAGISVSA